MLKIPLRAHPPYITDVGFRCLFFFAFLSFFSDPFLQTQVGVPDDSLYVAIRCERRCTRYSVAKVAKIALPEIRARAWVLRKRNFAVESIP
jgi:hypothetical protein